MHGEPFRGVLTKPERHSAVQQREQRVRKLSRAQARAVVFRREHSRCQRCHRAVTDDCWPWEWRRAHVNELVPRSLGGDPCDPVNLELCCHDCHMPNGEHAPTQARMERLLALAAKAKRLKREAQR